MNGPFKVFALIFLSGLMSCSERTKTVTGAAEEPYHKTFRVDSERMVSFQSDTVDFGSIRQGEVLTYRLGLENTDSVSMVLLNVTTDCGCATLDYGKEPVRPGETTYVDLRYDSRGQHGWQFKSIRIYTTLHPQPFLLRFLVNVTDR